MLGWARFSEPDAAIVLHFKRGSISRPASGQRRWVWHPTKHSKARPPNNFTWRPPAGQEAHAQACATRGIAASQETRKARQSQPITAVIPAQAEIQLTCSTAAVLVHPPAIAVSGGEALEKFYCGLDVDVRSLSGQLLFRAVEIDLKHIHLVAVDGIHQVAGEFMFEPF